MIPPASKTTLIGEKPRLARAKVRPTKELIRLARTSEPTTTESSIRTPIMCRPGSLNEPGFQTWSDLAARVLSSRLVAATRLLIAS